MYIDLTAYSFNKPFNTFLRFKKISDSIEDSQVILIHNPGVHEIQQAHAIDPTKTLIVDFSFENIDTFILSQIVKLTDNYKVYTNSIYGKNLLDLVDYSKVHVEPFFLTHMEHYSPSDVKPTLKERRKFLYMVGKNRPHRVSLLKELFKKNLLSKGYVSYFFDKDKNFDPTLPVTLEEEVKHLPSFSKLDTEAHTAEVSHTLTFNREYYDLVDFVVIGETDFENNRFFFTEKISKCLLLNKKFILLSTPNALSILKERCQRFLNLDISHLTDWVDTSYDSEENLDKRIEMIVKEIEKSTTIYNKKLI